ncbi:MAG: IS110 family transposase [Candidatus Sericytochromatia bacterium]
MEISYIGLDVSKRFHVAYLLPQGRSITFDHTHAGLEKFRAWLETAAPDHTPVFGLEPTGPFTKTLIQWLKTLGGEIRMVPGVYTKRARYFLTASGLKTDLVDAKIIAELIRDGKYRPYRDQEPVFLELKELSEAFFRNNKIWISTSNRVSSLLDSVFPEMTKLLLLKYRTSRELIKVYCHPRRIVEEDPEVFAAFVHRISIGHFKSDKVEEILDAARNSVGYACDSTGLDLQMQAELLDLLEKQRQDIERQMLRWLAQVDYAANLQTIPGFGPILAGTLLGQLGDLRHYPNCKALYAATGLNLVEFSSGKYHGSRHISHMGSPMLRRCLFMAAVNTCCRKNSPYYPWYQNKVANKPAKVVLVAGMRKLLRAAHAIARDNVSFDASRF